MKDVSLSTNYSIHSKNNEPERCKHIIQHEIILFTNQVSSAVLNIALKANLSQGFLFTYIFGRMPDCLLLGNSASPMSHSVRNSKLQMCNISVKYKKISAKEDYKPEEKVVKLSLPLAQYIFDNDHPDFDSFFLVFTNLDLMLVLQYWK